jgi:hypothetical protein
MFDLYINLTFQFTVYYPWQWEWLCGLRSAWSQLLQYWKCKLEFHLGTDIMSKFFKCKSSQTVLNAFKSMKSLSWNYRHFESFGLHRMDAYYKLYRHICYILLFIKEQMYPIRVMIRLERPVSKRVCMLAMHYAAVRCDNVATIASLFYTTDMPQPWSCSMN